MEREECSIPRKREGSVERVLANLHGYPGYLSVAKGYVENVAFGQRGSHKSL